MKSGIHPEYKEVIFECTCGAVIKTKSTGGNKKIDICSNCHPFYAGTQKILDSTGRVERFKKKYKM
ncbi:MAG TPA: 50S ribosomal protein L31 [bacterium]|nr:50S ribosomal protein L31 [bacterium]HOL48496.1 50S ribosomal protein L31 [bacterium]HPQ17657.1 50S ribosomal protein L31 [bacterium]